MKKRYANICFLLAVVCAAQPTGLRTLKAQNAAGTVPDTIYAKTTYTYKVAGQHEINADVYRKPGDEILPAILWIHGGALIFGTRIWIPVDQLEAYLKAGFAVVAIDYRLAPETKLPEIIEDLKDAYAWLRAEGPGLCGIDPERIAVVGHSAGGYLTLMSGFCLDPRPDALVAFYGYGNITGPWYSQPDPFYNRSPAVSKEQAFQAVGDTVIFRTPSATPARERGKFYLYCRQQGLWPQQVGGHDPADLDWYAAFEPLRNLTPSYPPTVLLHGEKDTDVPFEQSERMAEELKRHGVAFEFIRHPAWGHGFDHVGLDDTGVQEAFDRVLAFLREHVRP
ncbi:MAG: alpha/beta hydrolase [Candidatus Glassbacteria bacterium]|nr:alpha/beta hydrolase [Candidatus Glassbacteria bacterium]